jgi:hypothetical protein
MRNPLGWIPIKWSRIIFISWIKRKRDHPPPDVINSLSEYLNPGLREARETNNLSASGYREIRSESTRTEVEDTREPGVQEITTIKISCLIL